MVMLVIFDRTGRTNFEWHHAMKNLPTYLEFNREWLACDLTADGL